MALPNRLNILVVEDDPSIRELIAMSLRDAGHHVIERTALNVEDSVDRRAVSLVVVDCNLPGKAASRAQIGRLRAQFPLASFIAISGYFPAHAAGHLQLADMLGADGVLGKPFTSDALAALVAALVTVRQAQQPQR
ncbi:response regulator [Ralstonia insidiosa]|uniref:response regulator n=1 Tax=Ralstonia insidiosa TaxID=190721 RepID=UPI001427A4C6|nr:response regulator [Ralstonia insidiosa]